MNKIDIDIANIKFDPTVVQSKIIEAIELASGGTITINDPTNPFMMGLECNVGLTNDALSDMVSTMRKVYPSIAVRPSDLYNHMSDDETADMFSVPSTGSLVFMINLNELIQNGYGDADVKEMIIPENTVITVSDTKFTTLNDISVTYHKSSGKEYVEQQINNESDISILDLGVLNSKIFTDAENVKWILFETLVKQVERIVIEDTIVLGMGFKKEFQITGQYFFSEIFVKNATSNGNWTKMKVTHSDIVFDPSHPTMHIKVVNNVVTYSIPEIYLLNNSVSGNIKIVIYTTAGEVYLNIDKFLVDDFSLTLGDVSKSPKSSVSPNVTILNSSTSPVSGGRNQKTLEQLRSTIIHNTTGMISMPITEKSLDEEASYDGFIVDKVLDAVTDRFFIATKPLVKPDNSFIKAKMDVFNNKIGLIADQYLDNKFINIDDDVMVIKSNTIFKRTNGKFSILSNDNVTDLANMLSIDRRKLLLKEKYYYTPYYYMVNVVDGITRSAIYDLDSPTIDGLKIVSKTDSAVSANIDKFTVYSTANGFNIVMSIIGNSEYDAITSNNIKGQLAIPISNSTEKVYFYADISANDGYLTFRIDTSFFVNDDDEILITNGNSELPVRTVDLKNGIDIILYTIDPTVTPTNYIVSNDIIYDTNPKVQAISHEQSILTFGTVMEYLWNSVNTDYTERKYQLYAEDIPMVYKEDVYDLDPDDGSIFTTLDSDGDGDCDDMVYNIKHYAGDPVLDANGLPLNIYNGGDVMLDDNGSPVIDAISGVIRYVDILMLEYEFKITSAPEYDTYGADTKKLLREYASNDVAMLNETTLENTSIFYIPNRSTKNLDVTMGRKRYVIPSLVSPVITLYTPEDSTVKIDNLAYIKNNVGAILHEHLDKIEVSLSAIKEDIIASFGSDIKGVKIEGLDSGLELELFNAPNNTNRLTINKTLATDINGFTIVEYDIDIKIFTI